MRITAPQMRINVLVFVLLAVVHIVRQCSTVLNGARSPAGAGDALYTSCMYNVVSSMRAVLRVPGCHLAQRAHHVVLAARVLVGQGRHRWAPEQHGLDLQALPRWKGARP